MNLQSIISDLNQSTIDSNKRRQLGSYANSEISKRWYMFNKTLNDVETIEQSNWSPDERVWDDVRLARLENLECDSDLRDHFYLI